MSDHGRRHAGACWVLSILALGFMPATASAMGGKASLQLIRMVPSGEDAERFSNPGWGGGVQLTLPMPGAAGMLAGVVGAEYVNLLSETTTTYEGLLRVEQQTNQYLGRFYIGPEFGPHGNGFFRPHVGANLALVLYGISTDVVVPDDVNRENEIRQSLRDENKAALGYDVTLGVDINPWNKVSIDVGARFVKSFNVPQQLGAGSEPIHPGYVQGYLGVAFSLGWMGRHSGN